MKRAKHSSLITTDSVSLPKVWAHPQMKSLKLADYHAKDLHTAGKNQRGSSKSNLMDQNTNLGCLPPWMSTRSKKSPRPSADYASKPSSELKTILRRLTATLWSRGTFIASVMLSRST